MKKVAFEPMNEIHSNEIKILEKLIHAIETKENVKEVFEEFLEDVKKHFEFEENLMKKYGFFAIIPHKMEHDRILKELYELQNTIDDYENLEKYFKTHFIPCLENHISTIDTVTAGFFNMIGAKV